MEICGACGSAHANWNLSTSGNPDICVDYTASGTYSGGGATVGGNSGGGYPVYPIPVINPFDDVFVPDPNTFDTSGNMSLPAELRCPRASAGDPGANKYFALVGNTSNKGYVFKAYWDFGNDRWLWKKIDDIDVGADIEVDNCGRAPGDANYGSAVSDGGGDEFYGFKGTGTEETQSCNSCASAGKDKSLCDIANNDFADNAYYIYPGGASQATIASTGLKALPGSFVPDTTADFVPTSSIKDGGTKWDYSTDFVYSPMYNAVVFVYGNVYVGGNPGNSSSGIYCKDSGCTGAGGVPLDTWQVSLISVGSIRISGNPSMSPANTAAGFWHLYIAGRDVYVSGNPGATQACASGCSTTSPSNVDTYAGIIAAHEQIQISGNPQILGFMLAENAIDCSAEVDGMGGGFSTVNGNPQIYYDCNNPPNPWAQQAEVQYWSYRDR